MMCASFTQLKECWTTLYFWFFRVQDHFLHSCVHTSSAWYLEAMPPSYSFVSKDEFLRLAGASHCNNADPHAALARWSVMEKKIYNNQVDAPKWILTGGILNIAIVIADEASLKTETSVVNIAAV